MFRYNDIFQIPDRCLLNKRLTKAFFLKNFDLSSSEKKTLNGVILNMELLANIKTSNSNIPMVKNESYTYEEVYVVICSLAPNQIEKHGKACLTLVQKYIPYHMFVIVEDENEFIFNTCDKRINQNDKNKRTIEACFTSTPISKLYKNEMLNSFYEVLSFANVDKTNMETLYNSYIKALIQFRSAMITGTFTNRTQNRTEEDMANLLAIENMERDVKSLIAKLKKESQLSNQVNLNIEIQKKRRKIEEIKTKLKLT